MLGFDALHTEKFLVTSTEQLQELLVPPTHPALQHRHRFNQLVSFQRANSQVGLQVALAVRGQTHQTGPQGLRLLPHTHVTADGLPRRTVLPSGSDLLRHFFGEGVFAELRADLVLCVTFGTVDGEAVVPVRGDAGEAEAVSAGDGDRLQEDIHADAALKLLLGQMKALGSHDLRKEFLKKRTVALT